MVVITVAPIALSLGRSLAVLLAMVGGGKCGNIISPNPNTIIAADNFNADLSSVMAVNIIPAVVGLLVTVYLIMRLLPRKGEMVEMELEVATHHNLPSFGCSMVAPLVTVVLLVLRPLFGIASDPLIALLAGGLAGVIAMCSFNTFPVIWSMAWKRCLRLLYCLLVREPLRG